MRPRALFRGIIARLVQYGAVKGFGQVVLLDKIALKVVGVLVSRAVVEVFHELGRGVAQVQRYGLAPGLFDHCQGAVDGRVGRITFGRSGQINSALRKYDPRFGHADHADSVHGGGGQQQGVRVGEAHIFGGQNNHAPCDKFDVFPAIEHPRQPVHGRVGVAAPHTFDKSGNDVVVLLAGFVVQSGVLLNEFAHQIIRDDEWLARFMVGCAEVGDQFQRIQ